MSETNVLEVESQAVAKESKDDFGLNIEHVTDINLLQSLVTELWKIIDSIDTVTDIAKYNDKVYRKMVESLQSKRFEFVTSDSYKLFLNNNVNTSIERTNQVNVEEVIYLQQRRRDINDIPLANIQFLKERKPISVDDETIERWKFVGLSNIDFVEIELLGENSEVENSD